jgi:hypothetical protein
VTERPAVTWACRPRAVRPRLLVPQRRRERDARGAVGRQPARRDPHGDRRTSSWFAGGGCRGRARGSRAAGSGRY